MDYFGGHKKNQRMTIVHSDCLGFKQESNLNLTLSQLLLPFDALPLPLAS